MEDKPEVTRWREYLRVIAEFSTPEEFKTIVRGLGTPEQVLERNAEIRQIIEGRRFRRWLFGSMREIAAWIGGVGGALMLLYAAWTWALPNLLGMLPPPGGG